jgi:hypothetical protein
MKKTTKKQKRKQQILALGQEATIKINQNRILSEQIDNYKKHIQMMKSFMNKYSQNKKITESLQNNNNEFIKNEFKNYFNELKQSVDEIKESTKKLKQKYENNSDSYFDDIYGDYLNYKQNKVDAFILSYSLEQKLNIIKKLKESIHYSKDYNIFREPKRETLIETKYSEDYIDDINQELQRYALYEFKQFNKYFNKCQKKLKKVNFYKNKINIFKQVINYFEKFKNGKNNSSSINKKNSNNIYNSKKIIKNKKITSKKNYKSEEDNNFYNTINLNSFGGLNNDDFGDNLEDLNTYETDQTFNFGKNFNDNLLFLTTENKKNLIQSKKNQKINIPKFEELFDLENNEGEKEAIIDDELHSDDEVVFEAKIKSKKKIIIDYLPKIKKEVPNLYLSQIEFNKSKVMNEADLYSYQRRKFQTQNVDENIKMMRKKLKIIKRRCKKNEEKYEALQNFIKECENDYNRLKSIKVQMSVKQEKVNFMKKEFFHQHTKDVIDEEDELNYQKEMDDYLNDPELNDPYFEQFQNLQTDITHRQIEINNRLKKLNHENIDNNELNNKKYARIKTHRESKKEKIKRANSK